MQQKPQWPLRRTKTVAEEPGPESGGGPGLPPERLRLTTQVWPTCPAPSPNCPLCSEDPLFTPHFLHCRSLWLL